MGGLKDRLPGAFRTFLVGAASLSAFPLVTAGFYSKEMILSDVWASAKGGPWFWAAGVAGAILTSFYTFRLVFVVFFGQEKKHVGERPGLLVTVPLVVLAVFSVGAGFVDLPKTLGHVRLLSGLLLTVMPEGFSSSLSFVTQATLQIVASFASLLGIYLAALLYLRRPEPSPDLMRSPFASALHRFWFAGWASTGCTTPFLWPLSAI